MNPRDEKLKEFDVLVAWNSMCRQEIDKTLSCRLSIGVSFSLLNTDSNNSPIG